MISTGSDVNISSDPAWNSHEGFGLKDWHLAHADELTAALEGHDTTYNLDPKLDENMITTKQNLKDTEKVMNTKFDLKDYEKLQTATSAEVKVAAKTEAKVEAKTAAKVEVKGCNQVVHRHCNPDPPLQSDAAGKTVALGAVASVEQRRLRIGLRQAHRILVHGQAVHPAVEPRSEQ